ncbi:hypothetical protein [Hymenobacter sediminicola]|uniref:HK97 gp10 family phage protein n=1 Tax=Hymenobacter sediminicola TaxID=2761579 RepID=A0A7G7W303_9BACT|nr:hypothetical protein [Hymenobacter sediminicola]QNH60746.1 hypothetical protein H4317_11140 [Hymenobacter sediminicola]
MDRLEELSRGFARLHRVLKAQVEETVRENTAFLEDANTEQLSQGKDSAGQDITPEYADLTIALKQVKGQPTDRVTLRDSGDFYTSIVTKLGGNQFELVATDPKAPELLEKYGDEVLGLSEQALDEFRQDYVKDDLRQAARKTLGL